MATGVDVKKAISKMVDELALEGKRLVEKAYSTKDFTDRTYNLHDSYGSAVYYNGVLQPKSIYYMNSNATKARSWYGEPIYGMNEMIDFFKEYRGTGRGFDLVLVAAMPYASILERGQAGLRRKYKVISGAYSDAKNLARKYKGTVFRTSTNRIV